MEVRKAGRANFKPVYRNISTPYSAFEQGSPGECRVNQNQMAAIEHLYNTSPSLQAARAILVGQLLSSGLSLTRSGEQVKLTATFSKHLESRWMPFARTVVDQVLMYGFCVVSVEEDDPAPFAAFVAAQRGDTQPPAKRVRAGVSGTGGSNTIGDPQLKADSEGADVVSKAPGPVPDSPNLVPIVPVLGSYEIALTPSGRAGYKRTARIFTTAPAHAYTQDEYAAIFFRTMPDKDGNLVSPVASAFEFASFTNALRELALSAEMVRATPTLVTQSAPRGNQVNGAGGIDPSNLFFDSESRAIQQQSSDAEASERTNQLALATRLAAELNRVRTTHGQHAGSSSTTPSVNLPPDIPPRLFALPEKQVLVPNALQPSARTDLEALLRMANENIACAMGVPASVIFEGKFSSNSMSQLQLLNTTVASLGLTINDILTQTYRAVYGGADDDELILTTAPLAACTEVQALYAGGLIDFESAMPAALHSLGCSSEEIASAVDRRREAEKSVNEMKKIEEKTNKAELKRREHDAVNPPAASAASAGGGGSTATKPTPKKPESEDGN